MARKPMDIKIRIEAGKEDPSADRRTGRGEKGI